MANKASKPTFKNDEGVEVVEIGVKKFGCIGASPPHRHPHIFLNMGKRRSILCPYCSTRYLYKPIPGGRGKSMSNSLADQRSFSNAAVGTIGT